VFQNPTEGEGEKEPKDKNGTNKMGVPRGEMDKRWGRHHSLKKSKRENRNLVSL